MFSSAGLAGASEPFQLDSSFCQTEIDSSKHQSLLKAVESRYAEILDLSANFTQESFFAGFGARERSQGKLWFKKPGKMDWVYQAPEEQRFVSDGQTLWYHQPDFNQVSITKFEHAFRSDLPVSFLLGIGDIASSFLLKSACTTKAGTLLEFSPKENNESLSLERFALLVRSVDHAPLGARIAYIAGNETLIVFDRLIMNAGTKDEQFEFTVPKTADVIDYREQGKDEQPAANYSN